MTTTAAELHRMVFGDTAKRPAEDKPWVCAETITVVLGGGHPPQVRRCRNLVGATPPETCQTGQGRCARHADHDGEEGCRHHPSWQRIVAAFWHAGHHHGQ